MTRRGHAPHPTHPPPGPRRASPAPVGPRRCGRCPRADHPGLRRPAPGAGAPAPGGHGDRARADGAVPLRRLLAQAGLRGDPGVRVPERDAPAGRRHPGDAAPGEGQPAPRRPGRGPEPGPTGLPLRVRHLPVPAQPGAALPRQPGQVRLHGGAGRRTGPRRPGQRQPRHTGLPGPARRGPRRGGAEPSRQPLPDDHRLHPGADRRAGPRAPRPVGLAGHPRRHQGRGRDSALPVLQGRLPGDAPGVRRAARPVGAAPRRRRLSRRRPRHEPERSRGAPERHPDRRCAAASPGSPTCTTG